MLVDRPRGARALLVLAHGAGAGMRHPFMAELAAGLADRKIATARWEFRYMTEGKRRPPRAEDAEAEVRAAWTAATARAKLPCFAGGKSFGGRMTSRAHAAAPLPGLRGLVFAGFPLHPPGKPGARAGFAGPRRNAQRCEAAGARAGFAGPRRNAQRCEAAGARAGFAGPRRNAQRCEAAIERAEHLARAAGPMLFVQGTRDELAELALLEPVIAALGPRATLHVIEGADHGFTRAGQVDAVAAAFAEWIEHHL